MLRRLITTVLALTICVNAWAQTEVQNPYVKVQTVAEKTFLRMKENKDAIDNDPEVLRIIMEEELMPHIDYQFAAYKVLGKNFRSVPREKIVEYVKTFRKYLITTYAVVMGYYDDQEVTFEPPSSVEGKNVITVRAVIKDDGAPDIKLAFQVRKDKKTGEWKAYDMVAEGISVIDSKRSEFESIIRQDGIDKVIAIMNEQINKPIKLDND